MAKKKEAVADDTAKSLPPDGSAHRPFPWVSPYPESKLDKDGKTELCHVRAFVTQDIIVNGAKKVAGINHVLPCDFAHQHAAVLAEPRKLTK